MNFRRVVTTDEQTILFCFCSFPAFGQQVESLTRALLMMAVPLSRYEFRYLRKQYLKNTISITFLHATYFIIACSSHPQNTRRLALLGECQHDCTKDGDCKSGLLCAERHRSALKKLNVDPRKAYCETSTAGKYDDVCYDPKKLPSKPLLKECQKECASDKQCMKGLECSKQHKYKLQKRDLDLKAAYCGNGPSTGACYDPKRLPPIVTDPKCPKNTTNYCSGSQPKRCVTGNQYCCRKFRKKLPNGENLCGPLQCMYLTKCDCLSSNELECVAVRRSTNSRTIVPNCLAASRCSN